MRSTTFNESFKLFTGQSTYQEPFSFINKQMTEDTPPVPELDPDITMGEANAEPELDQEELAHQNRLELLKSLNVTPTYDWKYLTDELIEDLELKLPELVANIVADHETSDGLFYEVLYSAKYYEARLTIEKLATILDAILTQEESQNFSYRFISVFNTFKVEDNLVQLLKTVEKMPSKDLATYLVDDQLVIKLNIIKDYQKNKTDYLLSNFVEQKKYNLLVESSEGFAKVTELVLEAANSEDSVFQVEYTVKAIERLIGHFSLDPTRVLDLLLDLIFHSILRNYRFCIDLLRKSQWWPRHNESDNSSLETLHKGGNKVAAQLLGYKLKYHIDSGKDLSETLKMMIPILIKEGFISFGDVVKYFGPEDEAMNKLEESVKKELDDEIFKASASALALSGPLVDDEDDLNKKDSKPKPSASKKETKEPSLAELKNLNLKVIMTKALLAVGLYWPSIYMLTKYPYLVHVDKEFTHLIIRLFNVMIAPLKNKISLLSKEDIKELRTEKLTGFARQSSGNDTVEFEEYTYSRIEVFRPLHHDHTNRKFIFFYHDWSSKLPIINTYEGLFRRSAELLSFGGAKIGEDPEFLALLARFGVDDLETSKSDKNYDEKLNLWFEYFRKFIFPASTTIFENSLTTFDIFELLKKFPLQKRYNLYGDMVNNISKNNSTVRLYYSKAEKQTKDVLKRITTENVKPMMRRFAKISFANPIPSFLVIVTQVESYDNLSNLMVEAARYFTDYAWDVLPFVLLMRLTARRDFVQSDGMNEAPWLQSLATFIAKLGKSYSAMNLTPILTYIIKDLHNNKTIGLTILRELVNQMGGIQQSSNLSANQIKLLNSGESLQRSINKVIFDTREECTKPALRLLNHLTNSQQLSELFILLCEFHKNLIEKSDDSAHFKVLSSQSDEIASVLHTYIELINYFLRAEPETFKKNNIELTDLITKYGIESSWAFELWRRNVDLEYARAIEYPEVDFETLNKSLYTSFWKLSLYDINYDKSLYTHEEERLKEANISIADQLERSRREKATFEVRSKEKKLKIERAFNEEIISQIPQDDETHKQHSELILKDFEERHKAWFGEDEPSIEEIQSFYQYCVIPRAIHSETDAIFTGKFLASLFNVDVSKKIVDIFLTSEVLDTLIYTITPLEAENLGFFLAEIFGFYEELRSSGELSNDVKKLIYSWHTKALSSIKSNIESENYMSRRNSFTLLKNLIGVYPIVEDHAEEIVELIEKVSNTEQRKDLKLASDAILAHIKSRSKKWIHLWDFYEFPDEEKQQVIEKRDTILKERERKKLEKKRAELLKQKIQHEAEIASRAQSRAQSRPQSRSSLRPESSSDVRLRPRYEEAKDQDHDKDLEKEEKENEQVKEKEEEKGKDKDGDISMTEDLDEIEDEGEELEEFEKSEESPVVSDRGMKANENVEIAEKEKQENNDKQIETRIEPSKIRFENEDGGNEIAPKRPTGKVEEGERVNSTQTSKPVDTYIPKVVPSEKNESTVTDRPKRFKDVTAQPALPQDMNLHERVKKIQDGLGTGQLSKLMDAINDKIVEQKIADASRRPDKFRNDLIGILVGYLHQIIPRSHSLYGLSTRRITPLVQKFPIPSKPYVTIPEAPKTRSRVPLPPQQAVSGYANKAQDKWSTDNRNFKHLPSGPSAQASPARQYNQGYRQPVRQSPLPAQNALAQTSNSAKSKPPPPPPPPPPPSSATSSATRRDAHTFDNSGGRTRSFNNSGYREKRPRRF